MTRKNTILFRTIGMVLCMAAMSAFAALLEYAKPNFLTMPLVLPIIVVAVVGAGMLVTGKKP